MLQRFSQSLIMNRSVEIFDERGIQKLPMIVSVVEVEPEVGLILRTICQQLSRPDVNHKMILRITLSLVLELTQSQFGNIAVRDDNCLMCLAFEGSVEGVSTEKICTESFFGHSFSKKIIVISNDVSNDPRAQHSLPEGHPQVEKFISIPLFDDEDCVGQISLANGSKSYSNDTIIQLLPLLDIISSIVNNYASPMDCKINQAIEIGEAKDKFLATMSHE